MAEAKAAEARDLDQTFAAIATQPDEYAKLFAEVTGDDFRSEMTAFDGSKMTRGTTWSILCSEAARPIACSCSYICRFADRRHSGRPTCGAESTPRHRPHRAPSVDRVGWGFELYCYRPPLVPVVFAGHSANGQVDIPETERESVIQPNRVADDLRRESVAVIARRVARHRPTLPFAPQSDNAHQTSETTRRLSGRTQSILRSISGFLTVSNGRCF